MFNVIVPTYNERENIKILLNMLEEAMEELGKPYKILVVDDNSPDGTGKYIESLDKPFVYLITRPSKLGLGTAYSAAIKYCAYPYTFIMDADLSHDPRYIKVMYEMKGSYDIVASTRYKNGGVHGWSMYRKIVSRGANNLAQVLLGLEVSDVTGSFRMYKTDALKTIIGQMSSDGYAFQMEAMYLAKKAGMKVKECPIVFYDRAFGKSKCGMREILLFLKTVGVLFFR